MSKALEPAAVLNPSMQFIKRELDRLYDVEKELAGERRQHEQAERVVLAAGVEIRQLKSELAALKAATTYAGDLPTLPMTSQLILICPGGTGGVVGDSINVRGHTDEAMQAYARTAIAKALKDALGEPVAWKYVVGTNVRLETSQLDHYYAYQGDWVKGKPLYAIKETKWNR